MITFNDFFDQFPYSATGVVGPSGFGDGDDFDDLYALTSNLPVTASSPWLGTATASGTFSQSNSLGGWAVLSGAATTDNSGAQIQQDTFPFAATIGKNWDFVCRAKLTGVTQSELLVGLAVSDTTLLDGTGTIEAGLTHTDSIGFYKPDGAGIVYGVVKSTDGGQSQVALTTLSDSTFYTFGFHFEADKTILGKGVCYFYIDGTQVGQLAVSSFTASGVARQLGLSAAFLSGDNSLTKSATLDYIAARQQR